MSLSSGFGRSATRYRTALVLAFTVTVLVACNSGADDGGSTAPPGAAGLTRLASVPLGAELTGLFVSEAGDLFFNAQHPSPDNAAPFNRASIGVVAKTSLNTLPASFPASPIPRTVQEKQRVMTAVGEFQILGQAGQQIGGVSPFGSERPDFNGFVPDSARPDAGYLFTNWEDRPGAMSRLHIQKDRGTGGWQVLGATVLDFKAVQGTWANCFGTVSPWGTLLSAEELYFDDTAIWNRGSDEGVRNLQAYLGGRYPNPYRYGYNVEVSDPEGTPTPTKLFALGRFSHENAVVMPDHRTVYQSDDGAGVVLFKFLADKAGDLSAGTLYAARVRQDAGVSDSARAGFDISWVELANGKAAEIAAWIAEYDGIGPSAYIEGATSYISDADICAWAEDKTGNDLSCDTAAARYGVDFSDDRIAFLESRKAAAALGASAEFNKMEGVNISYAGAADGSVPYMYLAMSDINGGMSDGIGDIDVSENRCGIVYRMEFADAARGDYEVTRMEPVVVGGPFDKRAAPNQCSVDNIANPDNIAVMDDGRVLIGEDTVRRENNMLWVWNPAAAE